MAAVSLKRQVLGGGAPIVNSTVTLWAASAGAPKQLARATTDVNGSIVLNAADAAAPRASYCLVAKGGRSSTDKTGGDNSAIALMTVVGAKPPARVAISEFTTIASVWTHNQFIDGTTIKGSPLALRIAAGNVPNFVDLQSGGYGVTIADGLNSAQTATLANFATLANVLAGCVTRVRADACSSVFAAAKGSAGSAPADTLAAAESITRYPWYQPERTFALLDQFYPFPKPGDGVVRPTPFIPYLAFAPSAWVLPLKFTGGGCSGGGKLMIDSQGNAWIANNFVVGGQNQDNRPWTGNLSKFAPDGKPLSPAVTGFSGGGLGGPGFGLTLDAQENVWGRQWLARLVELRDRVGAEARG